MDEARRHLERIRRNVEQLKGKRTVSAEELLSESFMRKHSKHDSLEELARAGGFLKPGEHLTENRFRAIPDGLWDSWIREATDFPTWKAMLDAAATEYVNREVSKGI